MVEEVIGRDEVLRVLFGFLADPGDHPDVLLLQGDPGIGKTTLLDALLRDADEQGYRVVASRPVEMESGLSYAGLHDVLEGLPAKAFDAIGGPQRRALEIALLDRDPDPASLDPRAVSFGLLSVLRRFSEAEPMVLAVDDIHWLDQDTSRALGFAVRRLGAARLKVAGTTTTRAETALDTIRDGRLRRITIGPLDLTATRRMLQRRLDSTFQPWLAKRIHEVSAGNPFFALELARAVVEFGEPGVGAPLPLPETVAEVARLRLRRLTKPNRRVLALAAALAHPTVAALQGAVGDSAAAEAALKTAVEAGFVALDGDRVRFSHPIVREAALTMLPVGERRKLHRLAAEVAPTLEERARHLALSAEGPDEEVAAIVEDAAMDAERRGAPGAAAELAELAATLSPPHGEWIRRRMSAADYRQASGDHGRARELVDDLVGILPPGADRAEALHRSAILHPDLAAGTELCRQAMSEAGDDPRLRGVVHLRLGRLLGLRGDSEGWEENLVLAVRLSEQADDDRTFVEAAQELAVVRLLAGRALQRRLLERAQARADKIEGLPGGDQPRFWLGMQLVFADALEDARTLIEEVLAETSGRGHLESDAVILVILADLEIRAGNWVLAEKYARRATTLAEQGDLGLDTQAAVLFAQASVQAHLGRVEAARVAAAQGSDLAQRSHDAVWWGQNERILGFLAVSVDDPRGAWDHIGPLIGRLGVMGIRTPSVIPVLPCAVEALIGLGRVDEAEAVIVEGERHGRRVGNRWTEAAVARSRGLLAGAQGRLDLARRFCLEAVERHQRLPYPFELARSQLALGVVQRRDKQKKAARESIQLAAAGFAELGATLWHEKARNELLRIGGRPAGREDLTATEREVAALVVQGRTNKEVAAALYVSVRAVEANLSRIYAKLGIRSRTELAHRLGADPGLFPEA